MAGWLGYTTSNELLNFLYRGTVISIGGSLYLRLLVEPSSRSGGGTETTYSGYIRLELPRDATLFTSAAVNGRLANGIILTFPTAGSVGNGDLVAFDVVDTPSGAFTKLYSGGPIVPVKSIAVGKPVKFKVSSLIFTF